MFLYISLQKLQCSSTFAKLTWIVACSTPEAAILWSFTEDGTKRCPIDHGETSEGAMFLLLVFRCIWRNAWSTSPRLSEVCLQGFNKNLGIPFMLRAKRITLRDFLGSRDVIAYTPWFGDVTFALAPNVDLDIRDLVENQSWLKNEP